MINEIIFFKNVTICAAVENVTVDLSFLYLWYIWYGQMQISYCLKRGKVLKLSVALFGRVSAISIEEWKAIYKQAEKSKKQIHSAQCQQLYSHQQLLGVISGKFQGAVHVLKGCWVTQVYVSSWAPPQRNMHIQKNMLFFFSSYVTCLLEQRDCIYEYS